MTVSDYLKLKFFKACTIRRTWFAYLLWEDFVYQVEHKDAKKSNEMYYPRFTKVIVNFFMTKDPSIPRRNKVNWNYVRDDQMFTTINLVSRHQNTQQFDAILPVELTNKDIRNSAAYKEYYAIASGVESPKTKENARKTQSRKQPTKLSTAKGLTVLYEVALTEAEQMKLATKRSLTQTHISQASGSGADKGSGLIPGVLDVPTYESDEEISSKSSDEDDDDDVQQSKHDEDIDEQSDVESYDDDQDDEDDDQTDSDNDGDDFVYPKFSTHDEEAKYEESFDPIVQTPSHVENSDDEGNDDASHGMNVGGDEGPNAEDDDNELYGDLNINLEDTVTLKRHRDDEDKDEEPSAGSDRGSKRRRAGKESESTSAPKEKTSKTSGKSTEGSKSHQKTASESAPTEEPMHINQDLEEPAHQEFKTSTTDDQLIAEASQHPEWFQKQTKPLTPDPFLMNRLKVDTLTPELLAGLSYELMKGSCKINGESARDVYSKRRIIAVIELQIIKWHNYKHLDWITVRRDDEKLYKFKEGELKRLRIQDIEDMLLLLVQGKLTNLTVKERFAFNVSLRMFTRSIVI
nr:hypothetical protein [Tanacetum cinerariifolium]